MVISWNIFEILQLANVSSSFAIDLIGALDVGALRMYSAVDADTPSSHNRMSYYHFLCLVLRLALTIVRFIIVLVIHMVAIYNYCRFIISEQTLLRFLFLIHITFGLTPNSILSNSPSSYVFEFRSSFYFLILLLN